MQRKKLKKWIDKCEKVLYNITWTFGEGYSFELRYRSVAQLGRALRSGRRGRRFESCHFDSLAGAPESFFSKGSGLFLFLEKYGLTSLSSFIIIK